MRNTFKRGAVVLTLAGGLLATGATAALADTQLLTSHPCPAPSHGVDVSVDSHDVAVCYS